MTAAHLAELPAAFDLKIYRTSNPDIAAMSDAQALAHYETYGRDEGRVASCVRSRHEFVSLLPTDAFILEIGPYCIPSVKNPPFRVRYLDALSTEGLRQRAAETDWAKPELVPNIDYVWSGQPYRSIIDIDFDYAYSAHCIEHQPCLISHLREVASILKPGGAYFVTIPDKRYCFDYYVSPSTIAGVIDAFEAKPSKHSLKSVLEHRVIAARTHNDAVRHWQGDHGPVPTVLDDAWTERLRAAIVEGQQSSYVDVHAWQFTPQTFGNVVIDLAKVGLIDFDLARVYPTVLNSNEFHAALIRR